MVSQGGEPGLEKDQGRRQAQWEMEGEQRERPVFCKRLRFGRGHPWGYQKVKRGEEANKHGEK